MKPFSTEPTAAPSSVIECVPMTGPLVSMSTMIQSWESRAMSPILLGGMAASRFFLLPRRQTEAGRRDWEVCRLPDLLELRFGLGGVAVLALGAQATGEAEERPAVVRPALQVLLIDFLGLRGLAGAEQRRA